MLVPKLTYRLIGVISWLSALLGYYDVLVHQLALQDTEYLL